MRQERYIRQANDKPCQSEEKTTIVSQTILSTSRGVRYTDCCALCDLLTLHDRFEGTSFSSLQTSKLSNA
jgi:hypothetical protein